MFLYYSVVLVLLVLAGPVLLASARRRAGIWQKLGVLPRDLPGPGGARPVWFHAVSVGEFNAVWPLIQAFSARNPRCPYVVSTATQTAQKLARERCPEGVPVFYFPLDLPWAVSNWLAALDPALVVIAETEIWPGFMHQCSRRRLPVMVVNGRISPRSFRGYKRWRLLFGPVLRQFSAIAVQTEADAGRYRAIAGDSLPVHVFGNLKFDGLTPICGAESEALARAINLAACDRVIVAGSTHAGEEAALLDLLDRLMAQDGAGAAAGPLRLILAPRHPERWDEVASLVASRGFRVRRYSRGEGFEGERDVYLLDTIGLLFRYYSLGTIAFVGGTLAPVGGHNLAEPYAYAVPVICGPHLDKTAESANGLLSAQALSLASNSEELFATASELLASPGKRDRLGRAGQEWLRASQGAVDRTVALLESVLAKQYNDLRAEPGHDSGVLSPK